MCLKPRDRFTVSPKLPGFGPPCLELNAVVDAEGANLTEPVVLPGRRKLAWEAATLFGTY